MTVSSLRRAPICGRGSRLIMVVRVVVVSVMVSALLPPGDWFGASPALAQTSDTQAQTPPAGAGPFGDVPDQAFFSGPVVKLEEAGVFDGTLCEPAMFCPDEHIDRKTMAVWVVRIVDSEDPPRGVESGFSDVDGQIPSFYIPFIARLSELGITGGCGDGSRFCPDRGVSRAQMAVFLDRMFKLPVARVEPAFMDVEQDSWYFVNVVRLATSGVTEGCEVNRFCPDALTTRAQMAAFLVRALTSYDPTDGPGQIMVHYCGPEGTYTSDDLRGEVARLNATVKPFFEAESSYYTRIQFAEGQVLSPPRIDWTEIVRDKIIVSWWENDCLLAAGGGDFTRRYNRTLLLMPLDVIWLPFQQQGILNVPGYAVYGGPAGVASRSDRSDRSDNLEAIAAHEIGHAFYNLLHPWEDDGRLCYYVLDNNLPFPSIHFKLACEWATVVRISDRDTGYVQSSVHPWRRAAISEEVTPKEFDNWMNSIMSHVDYTDFEDLATKHVACRHKQTLGWPVGTGCEFTVVDSDAPTGPTSTQPAEDVHDTAIAVGSGHSCGLRTDGSAVCWGNNEYGQTDAPAGKYTAIAAGDDHSCAIRNDQTITCWGDNRWRQSDAPSGKFLAVAAGDDHSCGIRTDNTASCWGANWAGQAGVGMYRWRKIFIGIAAGSKHSCGIRTDNTVVCWGGGVPGEFSTDPPGEFTAIAAGRESSCGIRPDSIAVCWKPSIGGSWVSTPKDLTGKFSTIATGSLSSICGIRTDQTVVCWSGSSDDYANYYGQLDSPSGEFAAIATGYAHSCGIRTDGTGVCWGNNDDGQAEAPSDKFKVSTR